MKPSNNLLAIVRAYDLMTPPAKTNEEFRLQSQLFLNDIMPYIKAINPLFQNGKRNPQQEQCQFDALLSVAFDIGLDLFFDSPLAAITPTTASKKKLREAFLSTPAFDDRLRPELMCQMKLYKMPPLSRRGIEFRLFIGAPTFTICRRLDPSGSKAIVYAPSVMHPLLQFLCRTR